MDFACLLLLLFSFSFFFSVTENPLCSQPFALRVGKFDPTQARGERERRERREVGGTRGKTLVVLFARLFLDWRESKE